MACRPCRRHRRRRRDLPTLRTTPHTRRTTQHTRRNLRRPHPAAVRGRRPVRPGQPAGGAPPLQRQQEPAHRRLRRVAGQYHTRHHARPAEAHRTTATTPRRLHRRVPPGMPLRLQQHRSVPLRRTRGPVVTVTGDRFFVILGCGVAAPNRSPSRTRPRVVTILFDLGLRTGGSERLLLTAFPPEVIFRPPMSRDLETWERNGSECRLRSQDQKETTDRRRMS